MGIFSNLFNSGNPQERFWRWFIENSDKLANVATGHEPIANELSNRLSKVRKGLVFLFGPVVDGKREFIVSADGNKALFGDVQQLVEAAPVIPGWNIIAFRPAAEDLSTFNLILGDVELNTGDVWFSAVKSNGLFELDLYIKDVESVNANTIQHAAFILLDHAIGEYNTETKIGRITFNPLPGNPVDAGLKPLSELPQMIC